MSLHQLYATTLLLQIKELETSSPFSNEREFTKFIKCCLQVDGAKRPSAKDAIKTLKNV